MLGSKRRLGRTGAILLLALVPTLLEGAAAKAEGQAATRPAKSGEGDVLNFSLLDYRGRHYELRRTEARTVVVFFTAPDCPIARQNTPKLQAINEEFGPKGVA